MARLLACIALFLCISSVLAEKYGFDQSLSYSGSSPDPGTGTVPTVPSVGGGVGGDGYGSTPSTGSGSVPSGGDGGYGGVPSVDPSGGTGGIPTVPSSGGIPTVPSIGGGIPTVPSVGGGIPTVPSVGGGIPTVPSIGGGIPTAPVSGGTSAGPCSCSFWAAHVNSWPDPFQLVSTVAAVFGGLASNAFPNTTLLQALRQQKTDPYSQLLRQGTTAMLNSYARPHFQYTPQAVKTHFNAALTSAHAASVQAAKFEHANNGYGTNSFCS